MDQDPQMQGTQPATSPTPATPPTSSTVASETATSTTEVQSNENAPVTPVANVAEPVPSTPATPVQSAEPMAPPKKKHTGLIVTIIVLLIVLLAGAGAAIWYFCFYSNPDKVAYDAVTGFLKQPSLVSDGTVVAETELDNGNNLSVIVGLNSKTNSKAGESAINVKVATSDNSGNETASYEYEVEASSIFTEDGVIYLRVNKLVEMIDQLFDDMEIDPDTDIDANFDVIYDLLGEIDGEWWQISVPDLVDEFIEDNSVARPIKEFYTCMIDASRQDVGGQIAEVYNQNQFLNIEKTKGDFFGNSTYHVGFDYEAMANFMNSTLDIEAGKEAEKCIEKLTDELDGTYSIDKTYVDASDIEEMSEQVEFEMVISNFGHELKAVNVNAKDADGNNSLVAGFEFAHPEVNIAAPQSYRPVTELFEKIVEAITEINDNYIPKYPAYTDPENPWDDDFEMDDDWPDDWNYN